MEGSPSKINPPNSHLSNPIHKEAMKLGEQKKKKEPLIIPTSSSPASPTPRWYNPGLFGSIKGWICGTNPLIRRLRQESLAQCAPPERGWLAPCRKNEAHDRANKAGQKGCCFSPICWRPFPMPLSSDFREFVTSPMTVLILTLVASTKAVRVKACFYFRGVRSEGFAMLRNVSK